jgi:phospholipid/cholesterol/gamma-HCH transport system substrate-binding protein
MEKVLATVDDRGTELADLIVQLRRLAAGFAEDRQAIGASLDGISDLTSATAGLLTDIRPPLQADIRELGQLAVTLDDSKDVVDGVLQRLPNKLDVITGTATYGSFFNFYLCGFDGQLIIPDPTGAKPEGINLLADRQFVNDVGRCKREGGPVSTGAKP